MRVTNSMISRNSMINMNNNKVNVDILNNQMTTQKKISRPSEDPIIAIRALRLRSNLNELDQYYERNIPDAKSWMEVTEDALENMQTILDNIYSQCVNGATDTLTQDDRSAILKNLQSLRDQVYTEGNADCAGRHVFTGYKTNKQLTFGENESETAYTITENISYEDIEEKRYYSNDVVLPNTMDEVVVGVPIADMPQEHANKRIRLSYEETETLQADNLKYYNEDTESWENLGSMVLDGALVSVVTDMSYDDWAADDFYVGDTQAIYFKETGELVLGKDVANQLSTQKTQLSVTYDKKGFREGELRPEHYFDCGI